MTTHFGHRYVSIVEIGTNSTKFLVAKMSGRSEFTIAHFSKATTRIGRTLTAGTALDATGVAETIDAINRFQERLARYKNMTRHAFCTFAFRRARNIDKSIAQIENALGTRLRILSGREEARFAYESARHRLQLDRPNTVLFDIGGGSTEIVLALDGRIKSARSLALGALHLTERFVNSDPISRSDLNALHNHTQDVLHHALAKHDPALLRPAQIDVVLSGGSATTIADMIAGRRNRADATIRSNRVRTLKKLCESLSLAQRKRLAGIDPARADIIVAGFVVIDSILRLTQKRVCYISDGGVREGVLRHLIQNDLQW